MSETEARELSCHSGTPSPAVRRVSVRVRRVGREALECAFVVEGRLERLRIPGRAEPRIAHGLWEHTCCEVFLARGGGAGYHELDLAPSGEWSGYTFSSYRERVAVAPAELAPRTWVMRSAGRLELEVRIELERLSAGLVGAPLRLALCAVIEEQSGRLSYWSLCHPSGRPDFHHADSFALLLEAPGAE